MTESNMTDTRLLALIEAYGADLNAFPEAERESARALLADSPDKFSAALAIADSMDAFLAEVTVIDTPDHLRAALIDSAPRPVRRKTYFSGWRLPVWLPVGAFASLAVGLFAGMSVAQTVTTEEDQAEVLVYSALGFDTYAYTEEEDFVQ